MGIKEYFKNKREQAKIKAEQNKLNKMFSADKKQAEEILKQFNFIVKLTPKNKSMGEAKTRIIDEHNLEYCFIPEIWNSFSMARKMAVMVKFSQKHNKYPLCLDDFAIPTEVYKNKERMIHIEELVDVNKLVIDYDSRKMRNSLFVLASLLAYEDIMKEKIFLENYKNYNSFLDFKSIEELKYFIVNREKLFSTYFQNEKKVNQKQLDTAIYQYKNNIDDRATMHAVDILKNVAFYAKEAEHTISFCDAYTNYWKRDKAQNIEQAFGGEENLKKQTIKFAYDLFYKNKETEKDVDLQTALNHFENMKEQKYDATMFPHIELPAREQQREKSKFSLEL